MDKKEFLEQLEKSLQGELPQGEIRMHLDYYRDYILTEIRKGQAEEDVISRLGDPRLLVKTILDTRTDGTDKKYYYENKETQENNNQSNQGFHFNVNWGNFERPSKWKRIAAVLTTLFVVFLILSIVLGIFSIVIRILWPIILIVIIIQIIKKIVR